MGMIGGYKRISQEQLDELLQSPDALEELLFGDEEADPHQLDVDKAWHGLHFLLNGEPWSGEGPLFNAVLGGTPIGEDMGYGPVRYLTPQEVRETAQALQQLNDADLRSRFDPAAFAAADIYPDIWVRDGVEGLDYVMTYLEEVRRFFLVAAEQGEGMLLFLS